MHYHFTSQVHRRASDGIHWNPDAVRMQLNIIMTHICLSRGLSLPGCWNKYSVQQGYEYARVRNVPLEVAKKMGAAADEGRDRKKQEEVEKEFEMKKRRIARAIRTKGRRYAFGTVSVSYYVRTFYLQSRGEWNLGMAITQGTVERPTRAVLHFIIQALFVNNKIPWIMQIVDAAGRD